MEELTVNKFNFQEVNLIVSIIKLLFISICTVITTRKMTKDNKLTKIKNEEAKLSKKEIEERIKFVESEMRKAAKVFDFEKAIELRELLFELKCMK